MSGSALPHISAAEIADVIDGSAAIAALTSALRDGYEPADDSRRSSITFGQGELLIMPSHSREFVGTKLLTVAATATASTPRIQGVYVLFDGTTLSPLATLDGTAVTSLRTPAVSLTIAVPALNLGTAPIDVVIFGVGPQGISHATMLLATLERRAVRSITYISRSRTLAPLHGTTPVTTLLVGDPGIADALRTAALVICATTARTPLFDSRLLADDAIVVAVGSHEPTARELDSALLGRATVIVEDSETSLREAGDVILAIGENALAADALGTMAAAVNVGPQPLTKPLVFKTVGMPWQDLVIASAIYTRWREER